MAGEEGEGKNCRFYAENEQEEHVTVEPGQVDNWDRAGEEDKNAQRIGLEDIFLKTEGWAAERVDKIYEFFIRKA